MLNTLLSRSLFVVLFLALFLGVENDVGTAQTYKDVNYEVEKRQLVVKYTREGNWLKEIQCLARNVHYEARGESRRGQLAVAKVTLNRVESDLFPNSICGVVNEGKHNDRGYYVCQFSWRCEPWTNPKRTFHNDHPSYQVALDAILGYDNLKMVTEDTYWFHTPAVKPRWRKHKQKLARVDGHIFYTNKPGKTGR